MIENRRHNTSNANRLQGILGDFTETYHCYRQEYSILSALVMVGWDGLCTIGFSLKTVSIWRFGMFRNFLHTANRILKRNKRFSALNLGGLAVGLGCVILLMLYIDSEMKFDRYHEQADRIYRVGAHIQIGDMDIIQGSSNAHMAPYLAEHYPEIQAAGRIRRFSNATVKVADETYQENRFYYADPALLNIFTWPLIQGDAETALSAPFSIVLCRSVAMKYFGSERAVGRQVVMGDNTIYQVTGVMADVPFYSTTECEALISFSTLVDQVGAQAALLTDWTSFNFQTYVLLHPGADEVALDRRIEGILHEKEGARLRAKGATETLLLQPLRDIYLRPLGQSTGPMTYVRVFSAVAALILMMACFNFMNLTTARAVTRAREVGVRKTLGASRKGLIVQFLSEAIFLSAVSGAIALLLVQLALPVIQQLTQRPLALDFSGMPWLIPMLLGLVLITGILAGAYPALLLSRYQPGQVLRGRSRSGAQGGQIRRVLVFLQFVISTGLLIATGVIVMQLNYLQKKDQGFNKEHVMICSLTSPATRRAIPVLKNAFLSSGEVLSVSAASTIPGWGAPTNDKWPEGFTRAEMQLMAEVNMDEDVVKTLGLTLLAGEGFSARGEGSNHESVIINEAAAEAFGWKQAVGKIIRTPDYTKRGAWINKRVVGVVKNFHLRAVSQAIRPLFMVCDPELPFSWGDWDRLLVRLPAGDQSQHLQRLKKIWHTVLPGERFNTRFLDETFDRQFRRIARTRNLFSYFAAMAMVVAAIGLLGMATYSTAQRRKEIGIRKVMGSGVSRLVYALSRELLIVVIAANALAWPVAFVFIRRWLAAFPYHMEMTLWPFFIGGAAVLLLSWLTIASQTVKAALANPIKALMVE